ncbi:hypothetical protein NE865_06052 [Phthorimaea operculella]|nr:hypothetical protein NE865_06052 [Phthorimaea operculella]
MQGAYGYNVTMKTEELNNRYDKNNTFRITDEKNFMNGIRNARNILNSLERSLNKTKKYEKKLIKCRASHSHTHDLNEWWDSDVSEEKSKCSKSGTAKSSRSQVNLAESWSTMSIVCLQYQYEELSKRYSALLQAYDERCSTLSAREAALSRLRQQVRTTHSRLAHAHRTVLMIGEKYLGLREKWLSDKNEYKAKISRLKRTVNFVLEEAESVRLKLDSQLAEILGVEKDAASAMLLDEIRKCNCLFLENLRLKAQLANLASSKDDWDH